MQRAKSERIKVLARLITSRHRIEVILV